MKQRLYVISLLKCIKIQQFLYNTSLHFHYYFVKNVLHNRGLLIKFKQC